MPHARVLSLMYACMPFPGDACKIWKNESRKASDSEEADVCFWDNHRQASSRGVLLTSCILGLATLTVGFCSSQGFMGRGCVATETTTAGSVQCSWCAPPRPRPPLCDVVRGDFRRYSRVFVVAAATGICRCDAALRGLIDFSCVE